MKKGIGAVVIVLLVIVGFLVYRMVFYYPDQLSQYPEEISEEEISYLWIFCDYNKESKDYYISRDNEAYEEIKKILNDTSVKDTKIKKKDIVDAAKVEDKEYWGITFWSDDDENSVYSLDKIRGKRKKLSLYVGRDCKYYAYKEDLDKMIWECISSYEREFTIQDLKDLCEKKEEILCKEFDLCSNAEDLTAGKKIIFENGWHLNVIMENGYVPDEAPTRLLLFKTEQEYMDIRDEGIMEFISESSEEK